MDECRAGAVRAVLAAIMLVAPVAARAAEQLDWCAPLVVRPDQRFYTYSPPCTPWWPDDEIARRADFVLDGFLHPTTSGIAPDQSSCFGPNTMAASKAYHDRLRALAAGYGRSLTFVYQARFDVVDRHTMATPGFDADYLVESARGWRASTDFFQRDASPSCACGCEWSDAPGPFHPDAPPFRMRDLIDADGGPDSYQSKLVYGMNPGSGGTFAGAPRRFFGVAMLADQTNPDYRAWRIAHMRDAIDNGGFDVVELNQKFHQYQPSTPPAWWSSTTASDVATYLRLNETLWSGPGAGYGYAEYVSGWASFADDLVAAAIPYEVNLSPFAWRAGSVYDDPATEEDESAAIRSVARKARWVLLQRQAQFSEAEFAAVIADIESEGHATVVPYDAGCGFGSPPGRTPPVLGAGLGIAPDAAVSATFTATSLVVSVSGTATGAWDADLWCQCTSPPCGAPDAAVTGQTGTTWQPPLSVCDASYRNAPNGRRTPRVEVRRAGYTAVASNAVTVCAAACSNGRDDDRDGAVDHPADPGCASATDLDETTPALRCDDGVDQDLDTHVDFPADPECTSAAGFEARRVSCGLGAEIALWLGALTLRRRDAPRSGALRSAR